MDSIVVLGDSRIHEITKPRTQEMHGGAALMRTAIESAVGSLDLSSTPVVLSFDKPRISLLSNRECPPDERKEVVSWQLRKTQPEGILTSCFRLFQPESIGEIATPKIGRELARRIADGAFAGRGENHERKQIAPDIVVIDDLGLQTSKIRFRAPKFSPIKDKKKFAKYVSENLDTAVDRKMVRKYRRSLPDEQHEAFRALCEHRENSFKVTLEALMARLSAAVSNVSYSGREYPIEPVVVMSANGQLPSINKTDLGRKQKGNIWEHLHSNEALRRRTVVLLDATDLRRIISISSGLSWERTVQDAIVEFKQSPRLRSLLDFGHVIIRFGLTGVLLISNDGNQDHTYTLYFNPDHDDTVWAHQDDGSVLGETAVLAATIVEHLVERCSWRSGSAILPDLRHALDHSLLLSVQRLLSHYELGYGETEKDFADRQQNGWFDGRVFTSAGDALLQPDKGLTRVSVQRLKLSPFRSRHWSILMQSSQTELNNVARDIVLHGPKVVFNTLQDPLDRFVERLIDDMLEMLIEHFDQYSLYSPLKIEKTNCVIRSKKQVSKAVNSFTERLGFHCEQVTKSWDTTRRWFGHANSEAIRDIPKLLADPTTRNDPDHPCQRLRKDVEEFHNKLRWFTQSLAKIGKTLFGARLNDNKRLNSSARRRLRKLKKSGFLDVIRLIEGPESVGVARDPGQNGDTLIRKAFLRLRFELNWNGSSWGEPADIQSAVAAVDEIERSGVAYPRRLLHAILVEFIQRVAGSGLGTPISAPILRLGREPKANETDKRLIVIDRKEVESIRAVKRMIENYLVEKKPDRPLSIAVFGPPGSGKSVAVKKIIEMIKSKNEKKGQTEAAVNELHLETVNLSQLDGAKALKDKFDAIAKLQEKTPIVFFDEFDSALEQQELGWLKYFLAPMEDGEYYGNEVKKAVFVFAGGTSETFEGFSLVDRASSDPQWVEFGKAKGPDFVSRLRGHFNVVGINPAGQDDGLYLVRRALAIRFQLSGKQPLGDCGLAEIDENMLNAFLHVPKYRHGARSVRMLLDLCTNRDNVTISMSEVPPIHQLNMQVDGKSFVDLALGQSKPTLLAETPLLPHRSSS